MKILITLAQVLLFLLVMGISVTTTWFGGYLMWTAGLNPSFFGTLALAFAGFCIFLLGLAAVGGVVVFSFFALDDAKSELKRRLGR